MKKITLHGVERFKIETPSGEEIELSKSEISSHLILGGILSKITPEGSRPIGVLSHKGITYFARQWAVTAIAAWGEKREDLLEAIKTLDRWLEGANPPSDVELRSVWSSLGKKEGTPPLYAVIWAYEAALNPKDCHFSCGRGAWVAYGTISYEEQADLILEWLSSPKSLWAL